MFDLFNSYIKFDDDVSSVSMWCDDQYQNHFAEYFKECRTLFARLKSKRTPITDDELSWILINLPLNLFDVSERLNKFKVGQEVIKIRIKQKESDIIKHSEARSATKRQGEAAMAVIEDKLLVSAYSYVISRVEDEISFCKELIMGAKKLWDARRKTESVNPVSPIDNSTTQLPDYQVNQYIKGGV